MLGWYYNIKASINTTKYECLIKLRYPQIKVGKNLKILGKMLYSFSNESIVSIGDNVVFRSSTKYNFVGINKPNSIAVNKQAHLKIGNNSGFSGTSIFASKNISIGNDCDFGGNTAIWDTDFHPLDHLERRVHDVTKVISRPITIGNDVFVGANAIILKGVSIGDRVIIGAGSVVVKDIPSDEVWAGNPAKFIRKVNAE